VQVSWERAGENVESLESSMIHLTIRSDEIIREIREFHLEGGRASLPDPGEEEMVIPILVDKVSPGKVEAALSWSFCVLDRAGNSSSPMKGSLPFQAVRFKTASEVLDSFQWDKVFQCLEADTKVQNADERILAVWRKAIEQGLEKTDKTGWQYEWEYSVVANAEKAYSILMKAGSALSARGEDGLPKKVKEGMTSVKKRLEEWNDLFGFTFHPPGNARSGFTENY